MFQERCIQQKLHNCNENFTSSVRVFSQNCFAGWFLGLVWTGAASGYLIQKTPSIAFALHKVHQQVLDTFSCKVQVTGSRRKDRAGTVVVIGLRNFICKSSNFTSILLTCFRNCGSAALFLVDVSVMLYQTGPTQKNAHMMNISECKPSWISHTQTGHGFWVLNTG